MSYGTKIIELERDKAVSKEKLLNLANLLDSNSQSSNDQVKTLQVKISDLEVKSTKEIVQLKKSCESLKSELQAKEYKLTDMKNNSEKETALNEEKFKFLTAQKKQAKELQKDNQRKFEMTIQQIQKLRAQEISQKDEQAKTQISEIEKKHLALIEEKKASFERYKLENKKQID